jgi:quercetin dioxygenase-like cupin family protein
MTHKLIEHAEELTWYTPPGHAGTRNARLVERDFCGSFEMVRGIVQPGGEAEPHQHEHEYQVIYVLQGTAEVTLGEAPPERCHAGAIIRIPPRLLHRIVSLGPEPYEALVIYSPPLPVRSATPQE